MHEKRLVWSAYAVAFVVVAAAGFRASTVLDPGDGARAVPHAPSEPVRTVPVNPHARTDAPPPAVIERMAIVDRDPDLELPDGLPEWADLEKGVGTLRLRLRSDVGGGPAATPVRLWRLGVAASGDWSAGDEARTAITQV